MERAIRKSKRKCEALKAAVDLADDATRPALEQSYGKAAARLKKHNAEYAEFSKANGLKTRQDRLNIAGWDRRQARAADAAARKSRDKLDYREQTVYTNGAFRSMADPLADATGSAEDTNPKEIEQFIQEIEESGATLIREDHEKLAYSPGLVPGMPGTVYVSHGASYGAWLHEMRHMRDDKAAGWSGMRVLALLDERYLREVNAYQEEIKIAESIGREDIAEKLRENLELERRIIYGIR